MQNKVVIITGGSSGIGKSCAFAFGKAGAKVVITGRKEPQLFTTSQELTQAGITNLPIVADVSVEADNQRMVEQTLAHFGKIDVLINNAGISMRALFEELDLSVIRKVMETNFFGTVYATKYCLPHILQTQGSIIGISSIAGHRGLPARTGYSASKFAMQGFFEALRSELIYKKIHILVVAPGFTATNIRNTALTDEGKAQGQSPRAENKMMTADEVARYILKATLKKKRDLILTTQGKLTVWLNKFFPKLLDKLVFNTLAKEKNSPLQKYKS
ncbi:MAG: SDR family oxidoreductase [Microscillaceae bacterium]|nr:SDR family oxidoreductase [Microscillaceae bacterium]MDW8460497.1 SDR family oxidoreductase [Cytophagales bacterium]